MNFYRFIQLIDRARTKRRTKEDHKDDPYAVLERNVEDAVNSEVMGDGTTRSPDYKQRDQIQKPRAAKIAKFVFEVTHAYHLSEERLRKGETFYKIEDDRKLNPEEAKAIKAAVDLALLDPDVKKEHQLLIETMLLDQVLTAALEVKHDDINLAEQFSYERKNHPLGENFVAAAEDDIELEMVRFDQFLQEMQALDNSNETKSIRAILAKLDDCRQTRNDRLEELASPGYFEQEYDAWEQAKSSGARYHRGIVTPEAKKTKREELRQTVDEETELLRKQLNHIDLFEKKLIERIRIDLSDADATDLLQILDWRYYQHFLRQCLTYHDEHPSDDPWRDEMREKIQALNTKALYNALPISRKMAMLYRYFKQAQQSTYDTTKNVADEALAHLRCLKSPQIVAAVKREKLAIRIHKMAIKEYDRDKAEWSTLLRTSLNKVKEATQLHLHDDLGDKGYAYRKARKPIQELIRLCHAIDSSSAFPGIHFYNHYARKFKAARILTQLKEMAGSDPLFKRVYNGAFNPICVKEITQALQNKLGHKVYADSEFGTALNKIHGLANWHDLDNDDEFKNVKGYGQALAIGEHQKITSRHRLNLVFMHLMKTHTQPCEYRKTLSQLLNRYKKHVSPEARLHLLSFRLKEAIFEYKGNFFFKPGDNERNWMRYLFNEIDRVVAKLGTEKPDAPGEYYVAKELIEELVRVSLDEERLLRLHNTNGSRWFADRMKRCLNAEKDMLSTDYQQYMATLFQESVHARSNKEKAVGLGERLDAPVPRH